MSSENSADAFGGIQYRLLFWNMTLRRIRSQMFVGGAGWIWIFATPIALLAVYNFVFGVIFQSRVPNLDIPFAAWLAAALWPWLAFSDGVLKASSAIRGHADVLARHQRPTRIQ